MNENEWTLAAANADLWAFYEMIVSCDFQNEAIDLLRDEIPPFPDNQEAIREVETWAEFSVLCERLVEANKARQALEGGE